MITQDDIFNGYKLNSALKANNNNANTFAVNNTFGLRNSRILLHFKGVGLSYGKMSHWWGPGFHSSLSLSSNSPSQETYEVGTFKDINFGNFSFGMQMIVMPYMSSTNSQLYFSGLRSNISYKNKSSIITLGFHRTYLSGDFGNKQKSSNWSLLDAASLVFEPIFGQSKKNLDYTIPGTPGFDIWDEVLTGYISIFFPDDKLQLYADIASDDNRGNLQDLIAHWDHTLAYQIGLKKEFSLNGYKLITGVEYLTTRISNTFNSSFYRGDPNTINYYAKPIYDYFTYQGRRMGAHSGSSSDDLIFMFGAVRGSSIYLVSYNMERHGIKSMDYPELKSEFSIIYSHELSINSIISIKIEYENIKNFEFQNNNNSISKLVGFGYSYYFNYK
jgi:hypothetical protein